MQIMNNSPIAVTCFFPHLGVKVIYCYFKNHRYGILVQFHRLRLNFKVESCRKNTIVCTVLRTLNVSVNESNVSDEW